MALWLWLSSLRRITEIPPAMSNLISNPHSFGDQPACPRHTALRRRHALSTPITTTPCVRAANPRWNACRFSIPTLTAVTAVLPRSHLAVDHTPPPTHGRWRLRIRRQRRTPTFTPSTRSSQSSWSSCRSRRIISRQARPGLRFRVASTVPMHLGSCQTGPISYLAFPRFPLVASPPRSAH